MANDGCGGSGQDIKISSLESHLNWQQLLDEQHQRISTNTGKLQARNGPGGRRMEVNLSSKPESNGNPGHQRQ